MSNDKVALVNPPLTSILVLTSVQLAVCAPSRETCAHYQWTTIINHLHRRKETRLLNKLTIVLLAHIRLQLGTISAIACISLIYLRTHASTVTFIVNGIHCDFI